MCLTHPPGFPDCESDGDDGGDGNDDRELPVELNGPEDDCVSLEQVEWIERLVNKQPGHRGHADLDLVVTVLLEPRSFNQVFTQQSLVPLNKTFASISRT